MKPLNVANRTMFIRDNLEVLDNINSECVDLIYLDPPFNSNRNYSAPVGSKAAGAAFKDAWTLNDIDGAWIEVIKDANRPLADWLDVVGRFNGKGDMSYLIFMARRLLEMHRVLKPEGCIYLHCDPTMSHSLKMLMDCIFGKKNFRNEIVWLRATSSQKGSQHASKSWGTNSDFVLFYSKSDNFMLNPYKPPTPEEIEDKFNLVDEEGERYYDDSAHIWRTPNMGARPNLCYKWRGFSNPHPSGWRLSKERLEEEYQKGNIVILSRHKLQRRKYIRDYRGMSHGNVWIDINPAMGKERTGYPTQKPLMLLERIIEASSLKGDMVLDPFCGCATACVAAERLGRQWIGIDVSDKAVDLILQRLYTEELLWRKIKKGKSIIPQKKLPVRTDIAENLVNPQRYKATLYGIQLGNCKGCGKHFEARHMHVDHIQPRKKGGQDNKENLQLLCSNCNLLKSDGDMLHLRKRLKETRIL